MESFEGFQKQREMSAGMMMSFQRLAFYPQFFFEDLPTTSRRMVFRCKEVAEEAGLQRVRIGKYAFALNA